jgi:sulfur-carrier protein
LYGAAIVLDPFFTDNYLIEIKMSEHAQCLITLKLFAAYQDVLGQASLERSIDPGTTIAQLLSLLIQEHPELEPWRNLTRFGVNLDFVEGDTVLRSGDEVVLIPPVSGG